GSAAWSDADAAHHRDPRLRSDRDAAALHRKAGHRQRYSGNAQSHQYYAEFTARTMKCPICNRPVKLEDELSPFCSERCREVDLGNWATEKYVISTPAPGLTQPGSEEDED